MMRPQKLIAAGALALAICALAAGQSALEGRAKTRTPCKSRPSKSTRMWPKPLPNHWVLGNVIGVGVDAQDHVFIVHRNDTFNAQQEIGAVQNPPLSECCVPAPPVLEFDPAGNLVKAWGGPPADKAYVWPTSNHGISIDNKNNVWIGGNGSGNASQGSDSHILKFTHDGKYLLQIGVPGQPPNSRDTTHFGRVAKISFDIPANEAFVADGYANNRVAVLDMNSGRIKRYWGAYGNVPSDTNYGPYNPDCADQQAVQNAGALRGAEPGWPGLRVRPSERPHSSFRKERQVREGEDHQAGDTR